VKVLLLVHGLDVGGAESMLAHLARHLRAAGDAVEIGCLGELGTIGAELREEGISVVVHARGPGFDATLPARLARHVRRGRFDAVHLHQRTAFVYGALAGMLHTVPIAYTEHGPFGAAPRPLRRLLNRGLGRRAARISAVSRDLAQQLASLEGFSGRDIVVIPNGVDRARWPNDAEQRERARARCGLPPRAAILGSVGRLHVLKRHDVLVRMLVRLRETRPEAHLVLVGDGPEREALAALADQLGVAGAVHFLGMRRDVERILPAFDVFCHASCCEGIPLTVLEAMAARVPVVAVSTGGIPEAMRSEVEGLLLTLHDAYDAAMPCAGAQLSGPGSDGTQFAAAVERLLGDARLREQLVERAVARVQADFDLATVCRRYRELLAAIA